jgi:hypothetical protein
MNKKNFTISITQGIAVLLLLIIGTGTTSIFSTTHVQSTTLEEPYFVEKGMITTQKEIGPNKTQYTFAANGTMNGNIEVTDIGKFDSISKGEPAPGMITTKDGIITTKDGSETANYTGIDVGNSTDYQGASAYSTNSTGKLSFLNNMLGIYKGETEQSGNFVLREWQWK